MRRILFIIMPTLLLLAGGLSACVEVAAVTVEPTPTPAKVIDFTVKDLDGREVQLSSLRGQVVLVNFWATWCSPCKEEMPVLQAFYQAHQAENFLLLGVNVSDDAEDAARYMAENGFTFPVWSDPPGNILMDLGLRGLPASILVDADGNLQWFWLGPVTEEILEEEILPLL